MALARHGAGPLAALRALGSQVHPVFMLPPLAAAWFGALLGVRQVAGAAFDPLLATLHLGAVFLGLYTAHVTDGYVDFHVRGEDDDHPLTAAGCRWALRGAGLGFGACLLALVVLVDPWVALLVGPGWLIGYFHAPELDLNPLGATLGYPAGIALALLGGYYVQSRTVSATVGLLAAVFLVTLAGIKIVDDAVDYDYDRSIGKRTVAVAIGPRRAHHLAYLLMAAGMAAVVLAAVLGPALPPGATAAPLAFALVAATAWRAPPDLATKLLIRGSYVFLAVLVAAVWVRPLA
jgi:1,4-dihydroxy-2-naphthoate octaprenyltransferase